ncbi:hypothetical protein GGS24DRAFT_474069 [Hypoxylon argillaceum]|nr:hypothetical protein GGS24DRAFT_474069 [Hypoxylon argillaceum]
MADIFNLPPEAKKAFGKFRDWLPKQDFIDLNGLRFHTSSELVEECEELFNFLPEEFQTDFDPQKHDTRVTAIHVHESMRMPVKDGSNALLIPVDISDNAKIDDKELHELEYVKLKGGVMAEPSFYALLLLSRAITES